MPLLLVVVVVVVVVVVHRSVLLTVGNQDAVQGQTAATTPSLALR